MSVNLRFVACAAVSPSSSVSYWQASVSREHRLQAGRCPLHWSPQFQQALTHEGLRTPTLALRLRHDEHAEVVGEGLLVRPEELGKGEGEDEDDSLGSMAGRRGRRLAGSFPLATSVAELRVSTIAAVELVHNGKRVVAEGMETVSSKAGRDLKINHHGGVRAAVSGWLLQLPPSTGKHLAIRTS